MIKPEVDRSSLFADGSGFGPTAVLLSQMAVSNANCKNTCAGGDTSQAPMPGYIAPSFTCYTARISINNRNSQASTRGTAKAHTTLKVSTECTVKSNANPNTLVKVFWSVYSILCNWTISHYHCYSYPTRLLFILLPWKYTPYRYLLFVVVHHFIHTYMCVCVCLGFW